MKLTFCFISTCTFLPERYNILKKIISYNAFFTTLYVILLGIYVLLKYNVVFGCAIFNYFGLIEKCVYHYVVNNI